MSKSNQFQVSLYLLDPVDFNEINHLASFFYGKSDSGFAACVIRLYSYSGTYYIHVSDYKSCNDFNFRVTLTSDVMFPFTTLRFMLYQAYTNFNFDNDLIP